MGRPRIHDTGLPPCIQHRNGAYYFVKRGQWFHLGRDRDAALAKLPDIDFPSFPDVGKLRAILRAKVVALQYRRGQRNKGRDIPYSITPEYALSLAETLKWHCAVTGLPMSIDVVHGRKPYSPSLDRIDPRAGYEEGNCRVVCLAANLAMNVWGEDVLVKMGRGIVARRHRVLDSVGGIGQSANKINDLSTGYVFGH